MAISCKESPHNPQSIDPSVEKPIIDLITPDFMERYCERRKNAYCRSSGNLMRSPANEEYTEKLIAFHLGNISRETDIGGVDVASNENMDETHKLVYHDNKLRLIHRGDRKIENYREVVRGVKV